MRRIDLIALALAACALLAPAVPALAGVVNPDVSLIGQPTIRWTDAAGDPAAKRAVLDVGEREVMLDVSRRPGDSASTPQISPAFLCMTVNGIQDAAGTLRPYHPQEV